MSTVFGILRRGDPIELIDDMVPEGYDGEKDFIEVAWRGNVTNVCFTNELARYLPTDMKVYPLDNTAQGIYTIGDIIKEMEQ